MEKLSTSIYETLTGNRIEEYCIPGVENAFADGSYCMNLYSEMLDAYARVLERLGIVDEDDDIEIIINNLLSISKYLSCKMFDYGCLFTKNKK